MSRTTARAGGVGEVGGSKSLLLPSMTSVTSLFWGQTLSEVVEATGVVGFEGKANVTTSSVPGVLEGLPTVSGGTVPNTDVWGGAEHV